MRLIRALRDCNQRSLTVSKEAPTASNHEGGSVTGGYGFGFVSDMYPSPF